MFLISFVYNVKSWPIIRFSKGPLQGSFWWSNPECYMAKKDKIFSNNWSFCYEISMDKTLTILSLFRYHSCIAQVDYKIPLIDIYRNYAWGDLWAEGLLMEVAQYLRGSKHDVDADSLTHGDFFAKVFGNFGKCQKHTVRFGTPQALLSQIQAITSDCIMQVFQDW